MKKTLGDHIYTVGSSKQASDFQANTKFILNHIAITFREGNDIATALKQRQDPDFSVLMPTLKQSEEPDKDKKNIQQQQYRVLFEAEIKAYV